MKILDYLCNSKSEISNAYNAVEGDCLQAMKIVHYHANGYFNWLISGQQSDTPLREAVSILSGKYKRFSFVIPWGVFRIFQFVLVLVRYVPLELIYTCLFSGCGCSLYKQFWICDLSISVFVSCSLLNMVYLN